MCRPNVLALYSSGEKRGVEEVGSLLNILQTFSSSCIVQSCQSQATTARVQNRVFLHLDLVIGKTVTNVWVPSNNVMGCQSQIRQEMKWMEKLKEK
ncbi:Uncharacterized protein APZ42_026899 [Daphnia magna]|uniref:Uncharacterized protein n=1 Tax=Daphnia magna TaxID=35525 RepID=A0A162DA63_9CRUS|nr:Uncharacterized protein APZ42_026899 [Daphnia magna]